MLSVTGSAVKTTLLTVSGSTVVAALLTVTRRAVISALLTVTRRAVISALLAVSCTGLRSGLRLKILLGSDQLTGCWIYTFLYNRHLRCLRLDDLLGSGFFRLGGCRGLGFFSFSSLLRLLRRSFLSRLFLSLLGFLLLRSETYKTSLFVIRIDGIDNIAVLILLGFNAESVLVKRKLLQIAVLVENGSGDRKRIPVCILCADKGSVLIEQFAALCGFLRLGMLNLALTEEAFRNRDGIFVDKARYALRVNALLSEI